MKAIGHCNKAGLIIKKLLYQASSLNYLPLIQGVRRGNITALSSVSALFL